MHKGKKYLVVLLAVTALTGFSGCGNKAADTAAKPAATQSATVPQGKFVMHYSPGLAKKHGKTLELEKKPQRIVVLSNAALQIMQMCNVDPVAVTTSIKYLPYADKVKKLPQILVKMNQIDTESILALKPDLVIMADIYSERYGKILDQAKIPVYYTSEGPIVSYDETKEEAKALAKTFGGEAKEKEVSDQFAAVEKKMEAYAAKNKGTTLAVLFGMPPRYQQTSQGYLGSILAKLGFDNIGDKAKGAENRIVPLDVELLVKSNPQVIVALSPMGGKAETAMETFKTEFAKAPEIWHKLQAVEKNRFVTANQDFTTAKGIYVLKNIEELLSSLEKMPQGN